MTEARKMKATMGVTVVLRAQGARDTALADVTSRLAGRSKMRIHVEQPRNVYAPEVFLEALDQRHGPDYRYIKVRGYDGGLYHPSLRRAPR
jgi:hypothetical protein